MKALPSTLCLQPGFMTSLLGIFIFFSFMVSAIVGFTLSASCMFWYFGPNSLWVPFACIGFMPFFTCLAMGGACFLEYWFDA